MRISDWSSDVCSSDLDRNHRHGTGRGLHFRRAGATAARLSGRGLSARWYCRRPVHPRLCRRPRTGAGDGRAWRHPADVRRRPSLFAARSPFGPQDRGSWGHRSDHRGDADGHRSVEHTSELQSLMRTSYAVFCLKKKTYFTHTIKIKFLSTNLMTTTTYLNL